MNQTPWEKLTISSNFIFCKVMENRELCKKVIELILEKEISRIEYVENEKSIDLEYQSKSIRLDVLVKGDTDIFNLEMQVGNTDDLRRRSRFYQGLIDLESLGTGYKYHSLGDSYIIFICTFDLFGYGLPIYSFTNQCKEVEGLSLGDGTTKIFINTTAEEFQGNEALKNFCRYIGGDKSVVGEDPLIGELHREVERVKRNEKWRKDYMTLEMLRQADYQEGLEKGESIGLEKGKEEGREEGREELLQELILSYSSDFDDLTISKMLNITPEKVIELRNKKL